jgi:hypothetical protein
MYKFTFSSAIKRTQLFTGRFVSALILILSAIAHINAQGYETTSIDISDFSLVPSVIDTTNSSQVITVTLRATSPDRGISSITLGFRSNMGNQFLSVLIKSQHLISGNSNDGFYKVEAVIPQFSKAGTWRVFEIIVFADQYYRNFYDADLTARGFVTQFEVISNDEDITPPELSDFSFTPTAIDTINGAQTVTVTLRATDPKLGVRSVSVSFNRADDDYLYPVNMTRVSGDEKDGIYKGVITFSGSTASGTYNAYVFLSDVLFNKKGIDAQELAARGFDSQLQVNNSSPSVASISGRVISAKGPGVSKAVVTFTDHEGNIRYSITNPFGYYRFNNVNIGATYTLNVTHKLYTFTAKTCFVDSESISLNFQGSSRR